MGVEVALMAAAVATSVAGTTMQAVGQHKQNKMIMDANKEAAAAAKEQKAEIAEQKRVAAAERRQLVDEQRTQLGAGLGLDGITGTKYKAPATVTPGSTLG